MIQTYLVEPIVRVKAFFMREPHSMHIIFSSLSTLEHESSMLLLIFENEMTSRSFMSVCNETNCDNQMRSILFYMLYKRKSKSERQMFTHISLKICESERHGRSGAIMASERYKLNPISFHIVWTLSERSIMSICEY